MTRPQQCDEYTVSNAKPQVGGGQTMIELKIMQQQAGHEHASTTSIYTCVSSDFRTRTLRAALDQTMRQALDPAGATG